MSRNIRAGNEKRENILITGSSGFLGSALIRALAGRYNLIGFDREGPPHPPSEADCIFVDLTSDESVQNAFTHLRFDHGERIASVVHLSAYYDFSGAPSGMYDALTLGGTKRLLRELESCEVGQFVFSSTVLVHASCRPGERIDENWPLDPKWQYPRSKAQAERLIRAERSEVPVVVLRIAGVYDDACRSIPLSHQIRRIYERRLTGRVYPGDPSHGQPFVHLDDAVESIVLAIERRKVLPPFETLLIGEPETVPYGELQAEFGRLIHGEEWKPVTISKPLAKVGAWIQNRLGDSFVKPWMIDRADDHCELDIGRARSLLGWEPRRSLRETLPCMIAALKEDPDGWYRQNGLEIPYRLSRVAG